jgi:hypothetical protein
MSARHLCLAGLLLLLALAACGGGGPKLNAARITLELAYPPTGQPTATLDGQPAAAPGHIRVACRLTDGGKALGTGAAEADGSFALPLDADAFALAGLPATPGQINQLLECRAGDGPWVTPLRPPRVSIG